ncbi:hypothetical protein C8F01DRAFT_1134402 [Mycena amicta]|nr:hypothetical protein C8F01DRAFT_1134402 [Mycena amicta]
MSSQPRRPQSARSVRIWAKIRVSGLRLHACPGDLGTRTPSRRCRCHSAPFPCPSTLSIWSHGIPRHPQHPPARSKAPQDATKAVVDAMSSSPRTLSPEAYRVCVDSWCDSGPWCVIYTHSLVSLTVLLSAKLDINASLHRRSQANPTFRPERRPLLLSRIPTIHRP